MTRYLLNKGEKSTRVMAHLGFQIFNLLVKIVGSNPLLHSESCKMTKKTSHVWCFLFFREKAVSLQCNSWSFFSWKHSCVSETTNSINISSYDTRERLLRQKGTSGDEQYGSIYGFISHCNDILYDTCVRRWYEVNSTQTWFAVTCTCIALYIFFEHYK